MALGELYDRYAAHLLGIGVRMLVDRARAEDVLHDVFVEVWLRAGDFRAARGAVRAWLIVRMRSRCLDRRKTVWGNRTDFDVDALKKHAAPEQDVLTSLQRSRVREAMALLSGEQRTVIELLYFGGLTTAVISERLGVPESTVKSRLSSAREKMGRVL